MTRFFCRGIVLLTAVLGTAAIVQSCSDDTPVGLDSNERLKYRSCFDYSRYLHTTGILDTRGEVRAVAIRGDFAALADALDGVLIVDISDVYSPAPRGAVDTTGAPEDIVATGHNLWVAYGESGLVVVDDGNPDRPVIVGSVSTPGQANGIVVRDTLAYVTDATIGLMIFGVNDPADPEPLGVENSSGTATGVALRGDLAYVADRSLGLRVVNVVDPRSPWLVSSVPMPAAATGVAVAGDGIVCVATNEAGVQLVDVSVPGEETIVGSVDTPGHARRVTVGAAGLFIADSHRGTQVVDITSPLSPVTVNTVAAGLFAMDVAIDGYRACVAEAGAGLRVLDISDAAPPPPVAGLEPDGSGLDSSAACVAGGPDGVFAITSSGRLSGVSVNGDATVYGSLDLAVEPEDLSTAGGFVYVAAGSDGLKVVDVSDPSNPVDGGSAPYAGNVSVVEAGDSVVYFATGGGIFGIFQPGGVAATTDLPGARTSAIGINGKYAYVASESRQLNLVDVSDPGRPTPIGLIPIGGSGVEVLVEGTYVFLVVKDLLYGGVNGVTVFDATIPFLLQPAGLLELDIQPTGAVMDSGFLYLALGRRGVEVVDVTVPGAMRRVGALSSRDRTRDVVTSPGVLYVADGDGGLRFYDTQECGSVP